MYAFKPNLYCCSDKYDTTWKMCTLNGWVWVQSWVSESALGWTWTLNWLEHVVDRCLFHPSLTHTNTDYLSHRFGTLIHHIKPPSKCNSSFSVCHNIIHKLMVSLIALWETVPVANKHTKWQSTTFDKVYHHKQLYSPPCQPIKGTVSLIHYSSGLKII